VEKYRSHRRLLIVNIAIIVMVTMSYKTINVAPQTYEKLLLFKHGNMSFDDVLNEFMKIVEEKEFYSRILQEHKKRMRKIKSGDFIESDSLEEALANV
jgi:predicted CopG family antitoxin